MGLPHWKLRRRLSDREGDCFNFGNQPVDIEIHGVWDDLGWYSGTTVQLTLW